MGSIYGAKGERGSHTTGAKRWQKGERDSRVIELYSFSDLFFVCLSNKKKKKKGICFSGAAWDVDFTVASGNKGKHLAFARLSWMSAARRKRRHFPSLGILAEWPRFLGTFPQIFI